MNTQLKFSAKIVAAALVASAAFVSLNASAVDGTANADATVVTALTVVENTRMNFGSFTNAAGVISMDTTGSRMNGVPTALLGGAAGGTAGQVTVNGSANATYTVSGTGGNLNAGGATNLVLSNIAFADAAAGSVGTIGAGGTQVLKVGGDLDVPAGAPAGTYTGTYTVTVNYN